MMFVQHLHSITLVYMFVFILLLASPGPTKKHEHSQIFLLSSKYWIITLSDENRGKIQILSKWLKLKDQCTAGNWMVGISCYKVNYV